MISAGPFRRLMVERGLTNKLVADACGLPENVIQNFKEDRGLTYRNLNLLCKVLNVQPKDLIRYYEKEF